jgi:hypothetical protein
MSGVDLALGGGAGRVLDVHDFRRRGAPPRRRRRSPLLALAKPLGIAALTVALPLALGAWLFTSRQFQLHGIDIGPGAAIAITPAKSSAAVSAGTGGTAGAVATAGAAGAVAAPGAAGAVAAPGAGATAGAVPKTGAGATNGMRVPAAWVRQALAPLLGRNLLRLRLAEVRLRLAANPWIASAEVAKELPDRLRVTVAERRPAVLLRGGKELAYADAAGRPIAPVGSPAEEVAARRQGLLVLGLPRFGATSQPPPMVAILAPVGDDGMPAAAAPVIAGALRVAARLRQLRPGWTAALSQIDVVDEDDYQLRVEGLPCPLLVRGSRLADNLVRFDQLLPELRRRYPRLAAVDLRFSHRVVVEPVTSVEPVERLPPVQPVRPAQPVRPVPPAPATVKPPAPPPSAAGSRGPVNL